MDSGLYIHIPFCKKKCIYCDFYSVEHQESMFDSFLDCIDKELSFRTGQFKDFAPSTVFVGGGTPSILSAAQLTRLGIIIKRYVDVSQIAEFTFEANPGTLSPQKLDAMLCSGANRLSLGLQSADIKILKALGRIHTFEQFSSNIYDARIAGFKNISFDLMFGLPYQTSEIFRDTLSAALALEPQHISAYSLTVEESTPIARAIDDGALSLPDEETERSMYDDAIKVLAKSGFRHYELSNWALAGHECLHNLIYWHGGNYIGLGPGAHSLYGSLRFFNPSDISAYISAWKHFRDTSVVEELLSPSDSISEYMITGLRLIDGISRADFERRFNKTVDSVFGNEIERLINRRLLISDGDVLRLSRMGLDLGNQVFMEFV